MFKCGCGLWVLWGCGSRLQALARLPFICLRGSSDVYKFWLHFFVKRWNCILFYLSFASCSSRDRYFLANIISGEFVSCKLTYQLVDHSLCVVVDTGSSPLNVHAVYEWRTYIYVLFICDVFWQYFLWRMCQYLPSWKQFTWILNINEAEMESFLCYFGCSFHQS